MNLLKIGRQLLKANGFPWCLHYTRYWFVRLLLRKDSSRLYAALLEFEAKHNLPGFNTTAIAGNIWDLLPWEKERGEEWTVSAAWKQTLIDDVMLRYIKPGTTVLEIGPGAGRWTETLQRGARELSVVDVSAKALDFCKKRFASASNIRYFLTQKPHLGFLPDASIQAIWSFDVFVHINIGDTGSYLAEFKRVLVPGGIAVIHHPGNGGVHGGCRSRMTTTLFDSLLEKHGLTLVNRIDSWGENGKFDLSRFQDCISVFTA